jgi:hypothetical protein
MNRVLSRGQPGTLWRDVRTVFSAVLEEAA